MIELFVAPTYRPGDGQMRFGSGAFLLDFHPLG